MRPERHLAWLSVVAHPEARLAIVILAEIVWFAATAPNFWSAANAAELVRLSVELGLLALALTPIIIAGGIDLSVGSLMALAAIVFGMTWRDAGWPVWAAAGASVLAGIAGGALNATIIAGAGQTPLIVTLGTFSLFRGLAEGLTGGVDNYTGFPTQFLALGQGYFWGIPWQAPILALAALAYWLMLHRSIIGRALYAIGWSPDNARHAGIPVRARLALVYVLAGLASGIAAVVYVAHLGQAKADVATGYELTAITAVVIGGTSIRGGRGTVAGTLLGLGTITVLQNGVRLSGLPAELSGILTGLLLLIALASGGFRSRRGRHVGAEHTRFTPARSAPARFTIESDAQARADLPFDMRNSQLAVLCSAIVGAACIIAGSNWLLLRSLDPRASLQGSEARSTSTTDAARPPVIGMMPKAKGDPYFVSCRAGAEEAARELGATLLWDGPTELDPARQNEVVESWITRRVDVIAVSVENQAGVSTVLRKARQRGIKVLTWDADAQSDARDFLVNQATPEGIGQTLADEAARLLGGSGQAAIVTASLSAANQNEWIKHIRARFAERYPGVTLVAIRPSDGDRDRAFAETQTILRVYPEVRVIIGIAAPAVPGVAEAVRQSGRQDVRVTGLSLPRLCSPYIKSGSIQSVVLWNTRDLGYLTVQSAVALHGGRLARGVSVLDAGRLGRIEVRDDEVILGKPFIFDKDNIDRFAF
jgi:rhamnose transport system substrate-binding protein